MGRGFGIRGRVGCFLEGVCGLLRFCFVMFAEVGSQSVRVGYAVWMWVKVLYFGVLKDAFGCENEELELAEGATVTDLLGGIRGREVGLEGFWDSIAVAVNQEYAKAGDLLKDGDEVALLPPVSGGLEA
jgi:molybdopterin converting factor subunit 1